MLKHRGKNKAQTMESRLRRLLLLACMVLSVSLSAQETPNARQARRMFDDTYQLVYGKEGSRLTYAVNIIGIYKTEGTIWTKGKKSRFVEERYRGWNDGSTFTRVDMKKRTVSIYGANDANRDRYASKFTFEPNNYTYSIRNDSKRGYVITLRAKKGVKGIKEAQILLDHRTRYPLSVRIKMGIFHTTIRITDFHAGGISDDTFVFPRRQYHDFEVDNH